MSHSSKLMTISAVTCGLAFIKARLSAESLTIDEYFELFTILRYLDELEELIRNYYLSVEIDDAQQAVVEILLKKKTSIPAESAKSSSNDATSPELPDLSWEIDPFEAAKLYKRLPYSFIWSSIPGADHGQD